VADQEPGQETGEIGLALVQAHVRDCRDCAALSRVLVRLHHDLPTFAELAPDASLVQHVLSRTIPTPVRGASGCEAGYLATLVVWLFFGASWSPLRATAAQVLTLIQQGASETQSVGVGAMVALNRRVSLLSGRALGDERASDDALGFLDGLSAYSRETVAAAPDLHRKSPMLACLLSLMPGVGQIYVGNYKLGFIDNLIFGATIALLAGVRDPNPLLPVLGIFLALFFVYNVVDAGRRANLYNLALDGMEGIEMPSMSMTLPSFGGSIGGGVALIVVGVILLANTRFGISLEWIEEWWPLAPIGVGVYLLAKAVQERRDATSSDGSLGVVDPPTGSFGS
jgi:hypothetical protein